MNDQPVEYGYFYAALNSFAEKRGHGFQVFLSLSTKIAEPTISNIMNKIRLPNFGQQIKIAKALEYEYIKFLSFGRDLLTGQAEPTKPEGEEGGDYTEILKRYIIHLETENEKLRADLLRLTTGENDRRKGDGT